MSEDSCCTWYQPAYSAFNARQMHEPDVVHLLRSGPTAATTSLASCSGPPLSECAIALDRKDDICDKSAQQQTQQRWGLPVLGLARALHYVEDAAPRQTVRSGCAVVLEHRTRPDQVLLNER